MSATIHTRKLQVVLATLMVGVISLPAHATIFEDFLFDDPVGTAIDAAANSANPGNFFDADPDNIDVVTNGSGQLNASLKNNISFGTNYVDIDPITTGTVYGVIELTWDFQSPLDSNENEQIRFGLINDDPRLTTITGEIEIERTDANQIVVTGQAGGTGSTDLTNIVLNGGSLTQSSTFIGVVAANLDNSTYEILYSTDAGNTFASAGTANSSPGRIVESLRMALNNDLVNDNVLIDRFYLTDVNPVPDLNKLTLEVNTTTGQVALLNDTAVSFDIDLYRVTSATSELDFGAWNSLSDQGIDAVDGPDLGTTPGDGIGETWDEAGGSSDDILSEFFLLGSSVFDPAESIGIGKAFQAGGDLSMLEFQYRDAPTGNLIIGNIVEVTGGVTGDFNNDNRWDCADINALTAAIASGSTDLAFDMNGDGEINLADITDAAAGWLTVGGAENDGDTGGNAFLVGDANLDGAVDVSDFNRWNTNKFTAVPEWCAGDFNADGVVDVSDFNSWNTNKFNSSMGTSAVPEPQSLALICCGAMAILWGGRRSPLTVNCSGSPSFRSAEI